MEVVRIERIGSAGDLPAVGEYVVVRIGVIGIRPRLQLVDIAYAVRIGVAKARAVKRAEMADLPLIRERIAVGGKALRARTGDDDVVERRIALAFKAEALERRGGPGQRQVPRSEDAVHVKLPCPRGIVESRRRPHPAVERDTDAPVRLSPVGRAGDGMAVPVEEKAVERAEFNILGHRGLSGENVDVHPDGLGTIRRRCAGKEHGRGLFRRDLERGGTRPHDALLHKRRARTGDTPAVLAVEVAERDLGKLEGLDEGLLVPPVRRERIRAVRDFLRIRNAVTVRVGITRRRAEELHLDPVVESVAVRVGQERIRAVTVFLKVRKAVVVGIAGAVAVERTEVTELPFVGKEVAVRGESVRTRLGDRDLVEGRLAVTGDADAAEGRRRRVHAEILSREDAVDIKIPGPVRVVETDRHARPGPGHYGQFGVLSEDAAVVKGGVSRLREEGCGGPDAVRIRRDAGGGNLLAELDPDDPVGVRDGTLEHDLGVFVVRTGGRRKTERRASSIGRPRLHDCRCGLADTPPVLAGKLAEDDLRLLEGLVETPTLGKRTGKRVKPPGDLDAVGKAVPVGIGLQGVRSVDISLHRIGHAVAVRVAPGVRHRKENVGRSRRTERLPPGPDLFARPRAPGMPLADKARGEVIRFAQHEIRQPSARGDAQLGETPLVVDGHRDKARIAARHGIERLPPAPEEKEVERTVTSRLQHDDVANGRRERRGLAADGIHPDAVSVNSIRRLQSEATRNKAKNVGLRRQTVAHERSGKEGTRRSVAERHKRQDDPADVIRRHGNALQPRKIVRTGDPCEEQDHDSHKS